MKWLPPRAMPQSHHRMRTRFNVSFKMFKCQGHIQHENQNFDCSKLFDTYLELLGRIIIKPKIKSNKYKSFVSRAYVLCRDFQKFIFCKNVMVTYCINMNILTIQHIVHIFFIHALPNSNY